MPKTKSIELLRDGMTDGFADKFGREIDYLRIAVTKECNLRCFYCYRKTNNNEQNNILSKDEIRKIVESATKLGISKIRFTGGEPLLRKDLLEIIKDTNSIKDVRNICLTTNGTLLTKYAKKLNYE